MKPADVGQAVVLAAAAARLTRLVTEDEITRPAREMVIDWSERGGPWRQKMAYLVDCQWCTSIWAAGAVLVASRTRGGRWLNKAGAVSMAAVIVLTVEELLDRKASP